MTDFFARLAERTLGAAPLAQPVIPPVFSPGPVAMETFVEAEEWSEPSPFEDVDRSASALPPVDTAQPPTLVAPAQPTPTLMGERTPPIEVPQQKGRKIQIGIEEQPATVQPSVPRDKDTSPVEPAAESPEARVSIPNLQRRLERQVILVPVTGRLEPTNPASMETRRAEAEVTPPRQVTAEPATLVQPQPSRSDILPPSRRDSPTSQAQTQPETPADKLSSIPPTESDAGAKLEPVIRVSIGRIEVRLVQAPLPPKPVAMRSTPALSLDEYLQQRDKDRR